MKKEQKDIIPIVDSITKVRNAISEHLYNAILIEQKENKSEQNVSILLQYELN